jgi:hypothetical protein
LFIRETWRRAFVAATIVSAVLWLAASTICIWRYLWPPDRANSQQLTSQIYMRASGQSLRFSIIRDYEIWHARRNERWVVVNYIDTFGVGMNTREPILASTQRWGVMVISIPYWFLTTVTAVLPFIWLIRVAARQQRMREAALAKQIEIIPDRREAVDRG